MAAKQDSKTVCEILDAVITRAKKMREEGILSISLDGLSLTLAPAPIEIEDATPKRVQREHIDPLRDKSTYQRGRMPGFERPREGT